METAAAVSVSKGRDHRENILDCVASSTAFFRSQQLGEEDLTFEEKRKIAEFLLDKNLPLFLQRYWKFVDVCDVAYFEPYMQDYEVNYYVSEITKLQDGKTRRVTVKNRRYEALRSLISKGSYFSDVEMRKRNPLLYEQLVGQYLSDPERAAISREEADAYSDSFSNFLMRCFDKNRENYLMEQQQAVEDAVKEEEDDDDETESELDEDISQISSPKPSDSEKAMLRNEFTNIMYENFLAGRDSDFDYSTVDDNADYDSVDQRGIDEEEKYFDEELPDSASMDDGWKYNDTDCMEVDEKKTT